MRSCDVLIGWAATRFSRVFLASIPIPLLRLVISRILSLKFRML